MTPMMQHTEFAERVWPEMLRLYADSRIPPLCLSLQEEFDADIPLLLVLVLADRNHITCTPEAFERFLADAAGWRETVVRPLRAVRQTMKQVCDTAEETALREDIKRVELQAEKLHVARLVASLPAETGGTPALADCYLAECRLPPDRRVASLSLFDDAYARQAGTLTSTTPHHP
jgi:uncharacterized protein (TIGR02444 family)